MNPQDKLSTGDNIKEFDAVFVNITQQGQREVIDFARSLENARTEEQLLVLLD